jgi:hypothetical protein
MIGVLIKKSGEYLLHKYGNADIIFAYSNEELAKKHEVRLLNTENCDSIFDDQNIELGAKNHIKTLPIVTKDEEKFAYSGYVGGFKDALKNNESKIFTEQQMVDALIWAGSFQGANQELNESYMRNYIQTQIAKMKEDAVLVEIKMQYLPVSTFCFECGRGITKINESTCEEKTTCKNWFPNYDDNGCLILTKKS